MARDRLGHDRNGALDLLVADQPVGDETNAARVPLEDPQTGVREQRHELRPARCPSR